MKYAFIVFEDEDMAEEALKRFNGKPKPYYNRPFKINWGTNKKNTATAMSQVEGGIQNNHQSGPVKPDLNNFLNVNSFELLKKSTGALDEGQRLQKATLKALGLSGDVQYQPSYLNTNGKTYQFIC